MSHVGDDLGNGFGSNFSDIIEIDINLKLIKVFLGADGTGKKLSSFSLNGIGIEIEDKFFEISFFQIGFKSVN